MPVLCKYNMKIHFISIGGSVMHQLAIALKRKGYEISGSDDEIFEPAVGNLKREGILPQSIGWEPGQIDSSFDAVILGMHAKEDNPELIRAKALQLPIYSFPEYIYQESLHKTRIVVGGSHGKTTTTAMIMQVLKSVGKKFDFLVGARLSGFDQSVQITDAPVIVCEGDEYPASAIEKRPKFHFLFPHIAVLTGIAWDHINVFPTFENYLDQFRIFINKMEKGGHLIYNDTDAELRKLVHENKRNDIHYHAYGIPTHTIKEGVTHVSLEGHDTALLVFGDHNLLNLHAGWLVCSLLNITAKEFTSAISAFAGASKRLETLAKNSSTVFYRDFAHAPSKVKATIAALKNQFPSRKLIAVLELHTYSSLSEAFMKEYAGAMEHADDAAVFYSQHALQLKRLPELSKDAVEKGFDKEHLLVFNERDDLDKWLHQNNYDQTVVVFMSSGNYDGFDAESFAKKILPEAD